MATTENLSAVTTPPQAQAIGRSNSQKTAPNKVADTAQKNEAAKAELSERRASVKSAQEKSFTLLKDLDEKLADAIQTLNDSLARSPTKANISHDDDLNRYVVRIADKESGEVVREIPSEDLLRFARHLEKLKGILFDRKV